ncbi:MAG TPA: response regulator transcription factor [Xanthobacteraceae bacterium]|nr:response regulator transcription factor [Xanthobacteraceae bacterium]
MPKQRILVVGDDAGFRATLARWLMAAGYSVELAESAKHARKVLANEQIGLAIVAADRLERSDLACELRAAVDRLILVTAPTSDSNLPMAQAVPADGHLARPLREDDVLARIDAVLRTETNVAEVAPELLRFAGYALDAVGRSCLDASGRVVALTRAELTLLLSLARRSGRVVSRDELTRAVAGRAAEHGDRSVDVLISRLRRKIEANPKLPRIILTVQGVGYTLAANPQIDTDTAGSNSAAEVAAADAAATGSHRLRSRPQTCRIRRHPSRPSAPKHWRVSPVSRPSF